MARRQMVARQVRAVATAVFLVAGWQGGALAEPPSAPPTATPPAPAPQAISDHELILQLQREIEALKAAQTTATAAASSPPAPAPPPPQGPASSAPLDVRKPPFGEFDFSWLNGNNYQPASLLGMGPLTWTLYIDAYYAFQFRQPIDHTIFPSTTAPRHNEISFNLGILGVEITGLDGPIGRLFVQYGTNTETDAGQDPTVNRGYFLTAQAFKYLQQAALGWHFHALHGINAEIGIFSSYIGLESYLPQENWSYTHSFLADATPYYFFGARLQLFATQRLKVELWLVNGWQTFGKWHESPGGGYLINWRPREWLSLVHSFYIGSEVQGDPGSLRPFTDNNIQIRYYKGGGRGIQSAAISLTGDVGYELRTTPGAPSGWMSGAALSHRLAIRSWLHTTVRGDVFYDQTGDISPSLPLPTTNPAGSNVYARPNQPPFLLGGVSVNLDVLPNPWILVRVEYSHRWSNQPYFSGPGGITGPTGVQTPAAATGFVPDLTTSDDRLIVNATLRL